MPRLWMLFVLAWLPVLAIAGGLSLQEGASPTQTVGVVACIAALGASYLTLTLRCALVAEDFSSAGPSRSLLRIRGAWLAAMLTFIGCGVWLRPNAEFWWLTQHAIIAAGLSFPMPLGGVLMTLLLTISLSVSLAVTRSFDAMLLVQAAFGAAATAIRSLTITVAQLRSAREELARLAVSEERLRFARDLHDLLGQGLSLIVLKSELARRLQPSDPARTLQELADIEAAARDALRQVRGAVTAYRQPTLEREMDAARDILAAAGITLSVQHGGGTLAAPVDALLAWTVREGVTNVIRHSRATRCEIELRRDGDRVRLELSDDGIGAAAADGAGHGLAGLRERARSCDGELHAGPTATGGYRLTVEVPEAGAEP